MKRLLLFLILAVRLVAQQPSQLTPFEPYQQPPYPALAGFRVQIAAGTVNIGNATISVAATTIYVTANSMTYIFLNTTTGTIQSNVTGFASTGIYPIATAASNASFVYTLSDQRPEVFVSGSGGGGGSGNVTGPNSSGLLNLACWNNTIGTSLGDCGFTYPFGNAQLQNSSITLTPGTGMTGGGTVALGSSESIGLANQTTAGTCTSCNVTVNAQGQITNYSNGVGGTPAGSTTNIQFNQTGAFGADPLYTYNAATHTETVENQIINGIQTFAQPYVVTTSVPTTPACTPGTAGTSSLGINSDGYFAMSVNGGACADLATSGGSSIISNPTGSQTINQPSGSQFNTNDLNNISFPISADNWSQTPGGSLSVGSNTITLSVCPRGLTTESYGLLTYYASVYISGGTGTAEAAPITATTCPQLGNLTGGTITVTAANTHSGAWTVGSASQGVQEAIFAAPYVTTFTTPAQILGYTIIAPGQYTWRARVTVVSPNQTVDFSGSVVTCTMADTCLFIGSTSHSADTYDVTIRNFVGQAGYGTTNGSYPMIEDDAQHTKFLGIGTVNPNPLGSVTSGYSFGSLIQVDNDEAAVIDGFSAYTARWYHCTTSFCSVAISGAGGSGNAGLMYIKNANMNLNCGANGVDNQNSNTLRISDSVIQSQAQFAVRSSASYSNDPNVELDNVYFEVAGCANSNPLGIGEAGLIVESGFSSVRNSTGPTGAAPQFVNSGTSGTTQFNYYIVVHTNTGSGLISPPYLAGAALSNQTGSSNITVKWPEIGSTAMITYDVIRTSGVANSPAPYLGICGGGSITTCGTVATGLSTASACSTVGTAHICSFVDSASASTTAATSSNLPTVPGFWPAFGDGSGAGVFWPGAVIFAASGDQVGVSPSTSGVYFDQLGTNVANSGTIASGVNQLVSLYGAILPSFFAHNCTGVYGGVWQVCLSSVSGTAPAATLLQAGEYNAPETSGLKGRMIFEQGLWGDINGTHKITLVDSNPSKTLNTVGLRPTYDANDTYIGLDNSASASTTAAQLAFGAPVSISQYIGNVGDNASYLERLTASLKTFTVPITTSSQITSTVAGGTAPFVVTSTTRVANLETGGNPVVRACGTTATCSNTGLLNSYIAVGTVPLVSGTRTVTGLPFAGTNWNCTTSDNTTATNGSSMVEATATTATVTGTGTDVISFICGGN